MIGPFLIFALSQAPAYAGQGAQVIQGLLSDRYVGQHRGSHFFSGNLSGLRRQHPVHAQIVAPVPCSELYLLCGT